MSEELNISEYFDGWEQLMEAKCNNNELMDIKSINMPDFKQEEAKNLDVYVYAGYLKPGYHQLQIYDPGLEKAFCKDFVLNLNLREDIYPEFPVLEGTVQIRKVHNVWKPWLEDTEEAVTKSFALDRSESDDFYVFELIKDKADAQKTLDILKESFDIIKIYQKNLQIGSNKYPFISWENTWYNLEGINETNRTLSKKE